MASLPTNIATMTIEDIMAWLTTHVPEVAGDEGLRSFAENVHAQSAVERKETFRMLGGVQGRKPVVGPANAVTGAASGVKTPKLAEALLDKTPVQHRMSGISGERGISRPAEAMAAPAAASAAAPAPKPLSGRVLGYGENPALAKIKGGKAAKLAAEGGVLDKVVKVLVGIDLLLGLIISLSSIFVVANTIKLTVFARRDQIEIMELVGATYRFIITPFLLEGIIEGIMAGAVASGLLFGVYYLFAARLGDLIQVTRELFIIVIVFGTLLGYIGSHISVRRFLRAPIGTEPAKGK